MGSQGNKPFNMTSIILRCEGQQTVQHEEIRYQSDEGQQTVEHKTDFRDEQQTAILPSVQAVHWSCVCGRWAAVLFSCVFVQVSQHINTTCLHLNTPWVCAFTERNSYRIPCCSVLPFAGEPIDRARSPLFGQGRS